ncbi:tetratricopeptide repeat protein [Amycolatopsis sp. cmx-4-68]|uniref:tetratricopeptide repeat protein n=1 Tax=Amycolatopsis sp. cmx-4-68 TaxID=2790938 RepID=UPI003978F0EF
MGFDVFINYRTADTAFGAAAIYESLAERLGKDRVFLDNQSLAPGVDYPRSMRAALESARLLLVLIGPSWLNSAPGTTELLIERERDWVRYEIRRALERGIPIVPVLLDGTALPAASRLPADVRRLTHHQTMQVRHRHLATDLGRLADRVSALLPTAGGTGPGLAPRQIPAGSGSLTGREQQVARLDALLGQAELGQPNVAVISGTAGVGKTALAVHWAHRAAEHFPDGQLYLDLHGYGIEPPLSPAEALAHLLRSLGVDRPELLGNADERANRYRTLVSRLKLLILLDNARDVAQVRPLLPGGGATTVLVTSRHQLGGLGVHHAVERVPLSPLDLGDAVELLRTIIGERVESEPGAARSLVALCSNLPLALRVAAEPAATRPGLRLRDLVERLTDERTRLILLGSGDPHSTVRTVFSWSYQALDGLGAATFRALGVHPGHTFDIHAVAATTKRSSAEANAAMQVLIDAGLATEPEPGRFSMHDLLRVYAGEVAGENADERQDSLQRLFDHYLHTSEHADRVLTPHRLRIPLDGDPDLGLPIADAVTARKWFDDELGNLVALCRVGDPGFDARRWQLAFVLRGYFYLTKQLDAWIDTHTNALVACVRLGDHRGEAVTRNNLGMALVAAGRLDEAMSHYWEAERLFTAEGDEHGVSNALANQATVLRRRGSYEEALRHQRRALEHYRRSGAKRNTGITLRSMARVHVDAGQFGQAVQHADEAVEVALGLDQDLDIAQAFNVLGMAHHRAGQPTLAEIATRQAIDFGRRCGSRHEEARAAHRLGTLAAEAGETGDARRWLSVALELYRGLGSADADRVAAELAALRDE